MIIALLLAFTATFRPATPTVGDRIVVDFPAPVTLDASPEFEVVAREGNRVVIRTFQPKPLVLRGVAGNVRFENLVVPVRSVLKKNDDLKPAPLAPPRPVPYERRPFIAIAVAAAAAALAWAAVWLLARRKPFAEAVPMMPPDERFRAAVCALRGRAVPTRWAALADATREYLAATRAELGADLTTSELLPRLRPEDAVVYDILRQGDLEKFSTIGPAPLDFDTIAARALDLIPREEESAAA